MSRNIQDFSRILETLEQLAEEGRSGTLFITTDDNHSARFVLENGEISAIGYSHLHGYHAVPKMQQIRSGSFRFVEGGFISMEEVPLPKTDELLAMIREGVSAEGQGDNAIPPGAFSDTLETVQQELILHLGPFADIVWDEYIEDNGVPKTQGEYSAMIQALAEEIDNPAKREDFKRKAKALV